MFPSLQDALAAVEAVGYADPVVQLPATVASDGIFGYVPRTSYRIGEDRKFNVYGDPNDPACIEIGLYRSLLNSEVEMRQSLILLHQLVPGIDISNIRRSGGKMLSSGLVAEIKPPSAPEALGGWWVSIYSLGRLHEANGSHDTVNIVAVPKYIAVDSVNAVAQPVGVPWNVSPPPEWTGPYNQGDWTPEQVWFYGYPYARRRGRFESVYGHSHATRAGAPAHAVTRSRAY